MKLPWMQWFPLDYIADTRHLSKAARSAWSDILNLAWLSKPRGVYSRTKAAMMRELDIAPEEWDAVIAELKTVADVTIGVPNGPEIVTVLSRRIVREESAREYERIKKRNQRCPGNVPPLSPICPPQEVRSQKSEVIFNPLTPASGVTCFYCKTAKEKAGGLRPDDTPPEEVPAPVWTCLVCAVIKRGRYFVTVEDCRAYIQRILWSTNRTRWIHHRKYAFGGKNPFEKAKPPKQPDPKPEDLPTPEEVSQMVEAAGFRSKRPKTEAHSGKE